VDGGGVGVFLGVWDAMADVRSRWLRVSRRGERIR
jgi:hypothetical protein